MFTKANVRTRCGACLLYTSDRLGVEKLLQVSAHQLGSQQILFLEGSQERLEEKESLLQQARLGELAHDRFQQDAQKRDILFHCIVHDFATPLSAVAGCLQLLAMESLAPAAQELSLIHI